MGSATHNRQMDGVLPGAGVRERDAGMGHGQVSGPRTASSHMEGITKYATLTVFLPNLTGFPSPRGLRCSYVQQTGGEGDTGEPRGESRGELYGLPPSGWATAPAGWRHGGTAAERESSSRGHSRSGLSNSGRPPGIDPTGARGRRPQNGVEGPASGDCRGTGRGIGRGTGRGTGRGVTRRQLEPQPPPPPPHDEPPPHDDPPPQDEWPPPPQEWCPPECPPEW